MQVLNTRDLVEEIAGLGVDDYESDTFTVDCPDCLDGTEPDSPTGASCPTCGGIDIVVDLAHVVADNGAGEYELERVREIVSLLREIGLEARYGVTLIREWDFKEYAQEFAADIGAIPGDIGWPCTCIDWDRAANDLQMDYSSVELDGTTYYYRA